MNDDVKNFCNNFDIVTNAMQMRTLLRWNGRDLRERENLAEHTHLVTACAIKLYDEIVKQNPVLKIEIDFEKMIRHCMLHDSLELLRGDILSITKDKINGLRKLCDDEEDDFFKTMLGDIDNITKQVVVLADLMACYKFVEYELRYPSNDFAIDVYKATKGKFDEYKLAFDKEHGIYKECVTNEYPEFMKGYKADAGTDIILKEDVTLMPMSSTKIDLNVKITPKDGEMALLCSRTSAAAKGIIVAMCPIDPNYTGNVIAIVHNISNTIIKYNKGEAFCQAIMIPFNNTIDAVIKKEGKRSIGKLGSTGN